MLTCASCGEENPERARFCLNCAAPLTPEPTAEVEERKVVTVLFCDLVGFTARAERSDPEDVRHLLDTYHARLRREIERFGGTIEKFIGDAVMAVFGAPVSHEDDAERGVRAALRILDAVAELNEERPGLDLAVRSRYGVDVDQRASTPFLGRSAELALLRAAFQRTVDESAVQLVTVTGEPGAGKSRLLWEFRTIIDDDPSIVVSWRQGRCLPYGEGITYWALGEMVKGQTGILESDGPDEASAKLTVAVEAVIGDPLQV